MSTETTPLSSTPLTTLRRHRERGQDDRAALYAVLDAGLICHLGVVADGTPVVLPTAYGRDGDTLYLHGSSANGAFWAADGQRICVTVTH
ncbi:MAG TPA: pyridoxamine 5'-phosphate oxidase family protein, partial [Trebonia sp.]